MYIKKIQKGFLLPDVMMAVFVISVALTAVIAVFAPLYRSEFYKRDEVIATGLAQEGIEIMHNVRDNNWKSTPPKTAFEAPSFNAGTYCLDHKTTPVAGCGSGSKLHNNSGWYEITGTGSTKFTRKITVTGSGAETRIVRSEVTWGSDHVVLLTSTLTNWGDK